MISIFNCLEKKILKRNRTSDRRSREFFLAWELPEGKLPLFYRDEHNIRLLGLEKVHPFDAEKYLHITRELRKKKTFPVTSFCETYRIGEDVQAYYQDVKFLETLRSPQVLARVLEAPAVKRLPRALVEELLLTPMEYMAGGTIMATLAALQRGWAINLGGGFHHASRDLAGGFCIYNDITMAISLARERYQLKNILYVDLDAHQGNGPERDFADDSTVTIFDMYNPSVYPQDGFAKKGISLSVKLPTGADDAFYISALEEKLSELAQKNFDLLFYNAGTDIHTGDALGRLSVSAAGIIKRDELVFRFARDRRIPVVMVLSGGYQRSNAKIIAESLGNLKALGII